MQAFNIACLSHLARPFGKIPDFQTISVYKQNYILSGKAVLHRGESGRPALQPPPEGFGMASQRVLWVSSRFRSCRRTSLPCVLRGDSFRLAALPRLGAFAFNSLNAIHAEIA